MRTRRTLRGHLSKVRTLTTHHYSFLKEISLKSVCLFVTKYELLIPGLCYALGRRLPKPGFSLTGWQTHRLGLVLHQQSE